MYTMPEKKPTHVINEGRFNRRLAHVKGKLVCNEDDCWIWASTCFKRADKYGKVKRIPFFHVRDAGTNAEVQVYARRWVWENKFGELATGTSVVNVCGEDTCVKPDIKHNRPMAQGQWLTSEMRDRLASTMSDHMNELEATPPAHRISAHDLQDIPPVKTVKWNDSDIIEDDEEVE